MQNNQQLPVVTWLKTHNLFIIAIPFLLIALPVFIILGFANYSIYRDIKHSPRARSAMRNHPGVRLMDLWFVLLTGILLLLSALGWIL